MYNLKNGQRCKVQHPGQCLVISTVVQCVKRISFSDRNMHESPSMSTSCYCELDEKL